MKQGKIATLFLLISSVTLNPLVRGQATLLAIDSLYISSLPNFYKHAEEVKNDVWEGMKLAPVCLFRINGPALLYNHPTPPGEFRKVSDKLFIGEQNELNLYGATQFEMNGVLTAIVDYGQNRYSRQEEVYAELFHELHHVYQRNYLKQLHFDNPALLLTYPENYRNDALKLFELQTLYKLCFEDDTSRFRRLLGQFYSCRLERKKIIGNYIAYEEAVENLEGPAFFSEYKFYSEYSSIQETVQRNYYERHFFAPLTTPAYGRESLRKRHLAAGMAMCYILNKHFDHWHKEYYAQELPLYDFFISRFNPHHEALNSDSTYFQLSKFHTQQEISDHKDSYRNFLNQNGVKVTLLFDQYPGFRGFDPMHAESINDSTVLHKTFLKLSGNENDRMIVNGGSAITFIENEIWFVKKAILFLPEENVLVRGDRIEIDRDEINVSWEGKLVKKNSDELIFKCEL